MTTMAEQLQDIHDEVRAPSKMAESAGILSVYIWPRLARPLNGVQIYDALTWVKHMQAARRSYIIRNVGVSTMTYLRELTDTQRERLAEELDAVAELARLNKGHARA